MAAAISVLPKSLLPSFGEIEEEMIDVEFICQPYIYVAGVDPYQTDAFVKGEISIYKMSMNKGTAEFVAQYISKNHKG